MTFHDFNYLNLLQDVRQNGSSSSDRTGTGTIKVFGRNMRFVLTDGTIPLLTTKKMYIPAIIHELLWYISGSSNIKYLQDNGVRIWNEWANENGDLGEGMYGSSWRKWPAYKLEENGLYSKSHIDQLDNVIQKLKTNPTDRRLIVTAWNPSTLPEDGKTFSENVANGRQALPACHYIFQLFSDIASMEERIKWFTFMYGENKLHTESETNKQLVLNALDSHNIPVRTLSLKLNMRSNDLFLGNPFNIVQYSILLRMVCEVVGMIPREFIFDGGDCHIYNNHFDQVDEQLSRIPYPSPFLRFSREISNIDSFGYSDFVIENYQFHPAIKAKVSV